MTTEINVLGVPELRNYYREVIDGVVIIRYLVRQPGERDWTPVKLFIPTEDRRRAA
jgi:transcription antitermination factor NusA-like protein